jgi:uncharacterized protein (TIGR03089 family)
VVEEPAIRLSALVHDLLVRRTGTAAGAQPLLVHRDEGAGTRVELSGTSLTNAVAKASALLEPEGPGASLALVIPPHWIGAAVTLAAWHVGVCVWTSPPETVDSLLADATVGLVGPDVPSAARDVKGTIYISRLHPFGLPFDADAELPWYVSDLAPALREGPDALGPSAVYGATRSPPEQDAAMREAALIAAARVFSASLDRGSVLLSALPFHDVRGILAVTLIPLLTGGSTVLVTGTTDPERMAEIAAVERATTVWTSP